MEYANTLYVLAIIFGFFMAWGVGANDVANAMGTSVGAKALTFKQAILVAAIFEATGTILAGGSVTQTIRGGIIAPHFFINDPNLLVFCMLSSLLAAGIWLLLATYLGWPVSTTHTIVGSLVGVGMVAISPHAIEWRQIIGIVLSWILTPFISGVIAFLLFKSVCKFILNSSDPFQNAKRFVPFYIFFTAFIIVLITLLKGFKHLGFKFSFVECLVISILISLVTAIIGRFLLANITVKKKEIKKFHFADVEKVFSIMMIFTASAMAFAHGSNDAANAIGPLAAIVQVIKQGVISPNSNIPFWILFLGAAGIVSGLAMYGYKVIRTIGLHITELTPSRGFAAELACATTVIIASGTGLPISTTQTLVGAVLGVGFARGIAALNLNVIRNIFLSWIITLPAGAVLAIIFFYILKFIF